MNHKKKMERLFTVRVVLMACAMVLAAVYVPIYDFVPFGSGADKAFVHSVKRVAFSIPGMCVQVLIIAALAAVNLMLSKAERQSAESGGVFDPFAKERRIFYISRQVFFGALLIAGMLWSSAEYHTYPKAVATAAMVCCGLILLVSGILFALGAWKTRGLYNTVRNRSKAIGEENADTTQTAELTQEQRIQIYRINKKLKIVRAVGLSAVALCYGYNSLQAITGMAGSYIPFLHALPMGSGIFMAYLCFAAYLAVEISFDSRKARIRRG